MKQFDAGFHYVQRLLAPRLAAGEIHYVDARHIHARNPLYESHHTLWRGSRPRGSGGPSELASEAPGKPARGPGRRPGERERSSQESVRRSWGSAPSPEPAEPWTQI